MLAMNKFLVQNPYERRLLSDLDVDDTKTLRIINNLRYQNVDGVHVARNKVEGRALVETEREHCTP
jgi:hypothetical protein